QSPKAIAAITADPKSTVFSQGTYGLGPYKLDASQSVIGDHCTYVPNPYYPGASKLPWGTVVTKNIVDSNTLASALQSGQVDVGNGTTLNVAPLAAAGLNVTKIKALV